MASLMKPIWGSFLGVSDTPRNGRFSSKRLFSKAVDLPGGFWGQRSEPRGIAQLPPMGSPLRDQQGMQRHSCHDLSFFKTEGLEAL